MGADLGLCPRRLKPRELAPCRHRHRGDTELAIDVEGDITIETFSGSEERDRRTDETAFFYWKSQDEEWVKGIDSHEEMPERLRGAFSWKRLRGQPAENERGAALASRASTTTARQLSVGPVRLFT
jgi:hypothetical protein